MNKNMKQQIEEMIKKNLPEKKKHILGKDMKGADDYWKINGFNQAISQINTSLIADEVLKVVKEREEKLENMSNCYAKIIEDVYDGEKIEVADKKRRKEYGLD